MESFLESENPEPVVSPISDVESEFGHLPLTNCQGRPAIFDAFLRGFEFESRTSRGDFWRAYLSAIVISAVLAVFDISAGLMIANERGEAGYGVLSTVFAIAWVIPWVALNVRRLHDVGYSGWYLLWVLTGVGLIAVLYWQAQPSGEADRRFKEVIEPDQPLGVGRGFVAQPQAERAQAEDFTSVFWFAFLITAMSVVGILGLVWIIESR